MKKTVYRTCFVCKEKTDKRNLYRIVRDGDGNVVFDTSGKMNGRGCYVCEKESCILKTSKSKLINHGLNVNVKEEDIIDLPRQIKEYIINNKGRAN